MRTRENRRFLSHTTVKIYELNAHIRKNYRKEHPSYTFNVLRTYFFACFLPFSKVSLRTKVLYPYDLLQVGEIILRTGNLLQYYLCHKVFAYLIRSHFEFYYCNPRVTISKDWNRNQYLFVAFEKF